MQVLLLEISSSDRAYEAWLGGKAICEVFDLTNIYRTYYKKCRI
jgi:hypothetical protein